MSDMGETLLEILNIPLDSDMGRVINYTIGEWLQRENDKEFLEQTFLNEATGKYLDLHGRDFNVLRKVGESDEDYRKRIIYESLGHLTIDYLITVYDVELYYNIPYFNVNNNTLTSDNPYLTGKDGFMGVAPSNTVKNILNKKFILDGGVRWL